MEHRFNGQGIEGIISKIHTRKPLKITNEIEEKKIVEIATTNPREDYGLPFSTWSLRVIAGYISKELNLVDSISHTQIRNILLKYGIRYRQSKITLGNSTDPEYHLKKKRIEDLRYGKLPSGSVLLYEYEKGPIAAKTHGGTSWSSIQSKVSKAQKIKGILNVFGVYDYTNNQMWTQGYKKKTGKQFRDFIKRVDQKYDYSIKQKIFLVLDNASIHKSNKVKETISKYQPRITLVFLPTRSPELNLIEVRWLWMHRQGINNSTFENE